jgi:hypothetical protein
MCPICGAWVYFVDEDAPARWALRMRQRDDLRVIQVASEYDASLRRRIGHHGRVRCPHHTEGVKPDGLVPMLAQVCNRARRNPHVGEELHVPPAWIGKVRSEASHAAAYDRKRDPSPGFIWAQI